MRKIKTLKYELEQVYNSSYITRWQPNQIILDMIATPKNYHLIKSGTGTGATHGVLNMHDEKIILISPTVQLVKDKELEHLKGNLKANINFYYGEKKEKIKDMVIPSMGGHIIMCTIDVMILSGMYTELRKLGYTLILDELHVNVMSSIYRDILRTPFENMIHIFKAYNQCITITATPLLDYPKAFEGFNTVHVYAPTTPLIDVYVTDSKNDINGVMDNLGTNKLLFFTNDIKMINHVITKFKDKRVKLVVGQSLAIQKRTIFGTTKIKKVTNEVTDYDNAQVVIASTAAVEGVNIDLPKNTDVIIHNKYNTQFGFFTHQNIIQALGRIREGFESALLFMDKEIITADESELNAIKDNDIVKSALTNYGKNKEITITPGQLKTVLKEYHYNLIDIDVNNNIESKYKYTTVSLAKMVKNVLESNNTLEYEYNHVITNTYISKRFNGFNANIAMAYMMANIITELQIPYKEVIEYIEHRESLKVVRLFKSILIENNLLKVERTSITLPSVLKSSVERTPYITKIIEVFNVLSTCTLLSERHSKEIRTYTDKYIDLTIINKFIITQYLTLSTKDKSINPLLKQRILLLKSVIDKDSIKSYSLEGLRELEARTFTNLRVIDKDKLIEYVKNTRFKTVKKQVKQLGALYTRGFKSGIITAGSRDFSAVTSLPIDIISIVFPYRSLELDISSAYPSFVDSVVDANIKHVVYTNIMEAKKCDRTKAKKIYNMFLNITSEQISSTSPLRGLRERVKFFTSCGYTTNQALDICDLNQSKGDAYRLFSNIEKQVISDLITRTDDLFTDSTVIRRHDSIIVFNTIVNIGEIDLTTVVQLPNDNIIEVSSKIHSNTL